MKSLDNLRKEERSSGDSLVAYILYDLNPERDGGKLSVQIFREDNYNGKKDYNGFHTGFFRTFEISMRVGNYVHPTSEIDITGGIDIYNYDLRSKFFASLSKIMKSRLPGMNFAQQIVHVLEAMGINTMIKPNNGEYKVVHGLDNMYSMIIRLLKDGSNYQI